MDGSLWKVIDTTRYYKNIHDDQLRTLGTAASGFLRYANFRGCVQLSPTSLRAIAEHCPNVERLNLTGCRSVSSKSIADVCMNMPSLLDLDLSGLQAVNNFTLQAMAAYCRSLQVLNIAWCKQISGTGLTKLTRSCQDLRKLNVSGCAGLEDRWMPVIGMNLPKLKELCLNNCSSLTDRGLIGLLSGLSVASSKKHKKWRMKRRMASSVRVSSLGHLLVNQSSCNDDDDDDDDDRDEDGYDSENDRRDDSDLENNPEDDADDEDGSSGNDGQQGSSNTNTGTTQSSIPNQEELQARLVYLGLSNCRLLTQEALRAIGHYCKRHLRRLELASCENLSDEGLVLLAQHCIHLRYLDLEDVSLLTDTSLRAFGMHLQKLERISLSYCENVTDQGVMRMLRPAPNPTILSTANNAMLLSNSEVATQRCSKLIHLELDNCLLITDWLLLEFAIVLEERKAAAMERQKERERKREERRERIRQKARKNEEGQRNDGGSAQDPSSGSSYDQSIDSLRTDELTRTSSPVNIPARFRHKPELASSAILSYSSSPLQPRSVLASTSISEEVAIKKTRAGMGIMVPTRSYSTTSTSSTSSSSISVPLWSGIVPSSRMHLNGKRNVRTRVKKPAQPTIQVFDCRNITLEGVEAAQARCPVLAVKSYYSWSHPSTAAPITSAVFGSGGDAEGLYDEGDGEEDDEEHAGTAGHNNNNSQTTLHHLQLQQQHFQQQLQRRDRAASLLYRARLGLTGRAGGSRDAQCPIL
ncbi:hypothetical protein BGZ51_004780 [Haplosporangium sp. Z 767]|nr:hypothetical protein BGZ51_004780 [Haplosporangium sp. Z 767]